MNRNVRVFILGLLVFSFASSSIAQQCSSCSGNPPFACCDGSSPTCSGNGNWSCDQGGGCALPPPALTCTAGQTVLCTCSGTWQCINNPGTPIIIDTTGKGFHLTSAQNGVMFDLKGDGIPEQIAWTDSSSGNAFLALDRDGDGKITSGKELFGNYTQQPFSPNPNGFLALAEFDKPQNGGNGDGIIDSRDAVYSKLLLWIDVNHDGISQPDELHALPELGIYSISLDYKIFRRIDQFGNQFRYRAAINSQTGDKKSKAGSWAFDVFLVSLDKHGIEHSAIPAKSQSPFVGLPDHLWH